MRDKIKDITMKIVPRWSIGHILVYALVCFLFFAPYMKIFYPGIVEIDTVFQIAMSMGYGYGTLEGFPSPFPVFDVRLIGAVYAIGETVLGDANGGIFMLCLFQCVGISLSISLMSCYLSKWNIPPVARLVVFVFMAVLPVFPLMAVDIGKDTIFCMFFVPFVLCIAEIVRRALAGSDDVSWRKSWKLIVTAAGMGTLSSLAVSKGIVIVAICLLAVLIYALIKRNKPVAKTGGCALAAFAALYLVFSIIVTPIMAKGLPEGSLFWRESLGTLVQQATYAVKEDPENISVDDMEALNEFYNVGAAVETYIPDSSDETKVHVHRDVDFNDAISFMRVYVSIGVTHPAEYWKSFIELYDGYWQAGTPESLMLPRFIDNPADKQNTLDWENVFRVPGTIQDEILALERGGLTYSHGVLPEYEPEHPDFGRWHIPFDNGMRIKVLKTVMIWGEIPIANLLVSKSLYVLYLPALLLVSVLLFGRGRRVALLTVLLPLFMSCVFAFLSPVDFARYAYPCMMLVPMCVAIVEHAVVSIRPSSRHDEQLD